MANCTQQLDPLAMNSESCRKLYPYLLKCVLWSIQTLHRCWHCIYHILRLSSQCYACVAIPATPAASVFCLLPIEHLLDIHVSLAQCPSTIVTQAQHQQQAEWRRAGPMNSQYWVGDAPLPTTGYEQHNNRHLH